MMTNALISSLSNQLTNSKEMQLTETQSLSHSQKEAIFKLWNECYPSALAYTSLEQLDEYFGGLSELHHCFLTDDGNSIVGWAFTFTREYEKWFAIIVDDAHQSKGCGTLLLNHLKEIEPALNGWIIDSNNYKKEDGSLYASPAAFYEKNGFVVLPDVRLHHSKFSAIKIQWDQLLYDAD